MYSNFLLYLIVLLLPVHEAGEELAAVSGHELGGQLDDVEIERWKRKTRCFGRIEMDERVQCLLHKMGRSTFCTLKVF